MLVSQPGQGVLAGAQPHQLVLPGPADGSCANVGFSHELLLHSVYRRVAQAGHTGVACQTPPADPVMACTVGHVTKTCVKCNEPKSVTEFHRDAGRADGRFPWCKACRSLYGATEHYRAQVRAIYHSDPDRFAAYQRDFRMKAREAVLGHYGRLCACCGVKDNLTIDHVAGNGADHRRELFGSTRGSSGKWYAWLVAEGFPNEYQTLCRRCNRSKGRTDHCHLDHGAPPRTAMRGAANGDGRNHTYRRARYMADREASLEASRSYVRQLRKAVLDHYGWQCACCGASERLRLDHVAGHGTRHVRESFGGDYRRFWRWLAAEGFPPDYQTLCMPCNVSKSNGAHCNLEHASVG